VIVLVLANQERHREGVDLPARVIRTRIGGVLKPPAAQADHAARRAAPTRVPEKTLEVSDLTVRYGATVAVDTVSLTRQPGRIIGLIGPNGAGKTSLIDAVTGFTRMARADRSGSKARRFASWSPRGAREPASAVVPVARAVRGLDVLRQPARRERPARRRLVPARHRLADGGRQLPRTARATGTNRPRPARARLEGDQEAISLPSSRSDPPAAHPREAGHRVDQRRLAGPVRPDETDDPARLDGERHGVDGHRRARTDGEVADLERLLRDARRRGSAGSVIGLRGRGFSTPPILVRIHASWEIDSFTMPFWFASTSTSPTRRRSARCTSRAGRRSR